MKTIGEVIKLSTDFLKDRKIIPSRRIVEELLCHVLHLKKMDLYLQFDKPIVERELNAIRELLKRCGKGEPVEYIAGVVEFYKCKIKLNPSVLIPRPETEILVEMISKTKPTGVLWDICTGSGCIGIALKKGHPELKVAISDISPDALAIAQENALLNEVEIDILQGDLLIPFEGQKADIIVCNPPYISEGEYQSLDSSVRDHEPKLALTGGPTGMEFYERLALELPKYLNKDGKVYFEIGSSQGESIKKLFPHGQLHHDWSGHPRFFII